MLIKESAHAGTEAVVRFDGFISAHSAAELSATLSDLASKGVKRIVLVLKTEGGQIEAGMQLYEELRKLAGKVKLVTHAFELVASMGVAVYLAGDERATGPLAKFMLHPSSRLFQAGEVLTAPDLRQAADTLENRDKREREILKKRAKLTLTEAKALVEATTVLDANEAVTKGIAKDIRELEVPAGALTIQLGPYAAPEMP